MKRLVPVLLLLTALLSACGGEQTPAEFDPAATAAALNSSAAFSETLEQMDADIFCMLYGLDEAALVDGVVYGSTGTTAEEFAVWRLVDEETAQEAMALLEQRVADQKAANESYRPQDMPKLESAILERRGATVLLVVANDPDAAQSALDSLN